MRRAIPLVEKLALTVEELLIVIYRVSHKEVTICELVHRAPRAGYRLEVQQV